RLGPRRTAECAVGAIRRPCRSGWRFLHRQPVRGGEPLDDPLSGSTRRPHRRMRAATCLVTRVELSVVPLHPWHRLVLVCGRALQPPPPGTVLEGGHDGCKHRFYLCFFPLVRRSVDSSPARDPVATRRCPVAGCARGRCPAVTAGPRPPARGWWWR